MNSLQVMVFLTISIMPFVGCSENERSMNTDIEISALVELAGVTAGQGVPCFIFRTDAGETISLTGETAQLRDAGLRATITGTWQAVSNCQQGRTLRVTAVQIQ